LNSNDRNSVRRVVLGLTGWGLHKFVENLGENSLNGGLTNAALFLLVNTLKGNTRQRTVCSTKSPEHNPTKERKKN
jgi:hypothetical protein